MRHAETISKPNETSWVFRVDLGDPVDEDVVIALLQHAYLDRAKIEVIYAKP